MILTNSRTRCAPSVPNAVAFLGKIFSLAALLACCFPQSPRAEASDTLRTVAFTGDAAPARAGDVQHDPIFISFGILGFQDVVLNDHGQTAFVSYIGSETPPMPPDFFFPRDAIVRERSDGTLSLVAQGFDPVPESMNGEFSGFFLRNSEPSVNNRGQVAFAVPFAGAFVDDGGVLEPIFGENMTDLIPGKRLATSPNDLRFNDLGQASFTVGIFEPGAGTTDDRGLFLGEAESSDLTLVIRSEDRPPSFEDFFIRSISNRSLNNNGELGFLSFLIADRVSAPNGTAILGGEPGSLSVAAYRGNPVPAMGGGTGSLTVREIRENSAFNDAGAMAFVATVEGPGVDFSNDHALFRGGLGEEIKMIARAGSPAPTSAPDEYYDGISSDSIINGGGQILFTAAFDGVGVNDANNNVLLRYHPDGGVEVIARDGDPAPGAENGVNLGASRTFLDFALNGLGQAAFVAGLSDNSTALYAEDLSGDLTLIVRTGDLLDVSDDPLMPDLREVQSFEFIGGSGNQDGRRSAFNERGQLAFTASFTDGSQGVFVSDLVAVPEPTSAVFIAVALTLVSTRRRCVSHIQ